jgi:hypothetical protein
MQERHRGQPRHPRGPPVGVAGFRLAGRTRGPRPPVRGMRRVMASDKLLSGKDNSWLSTGTHGRLSTLMS